MTDYNEEVAKQFTAAAARYTDIDDLDVVVELVTKDIMFALMPVIADDVRERYETILAQVRRAILTAE